MQEDWTARKRPLLERYPLLSCLLILLIAAPGMHLASAVAVAMGGAPPTDVWALWPMVLRCALALVFFLSLRRYGWASLVGFNSPRRWRDMGLVWLPALYILVNPTNLIGQRVVSDPDLALIAGGLLQGASVGLFEETCFRGLVLAILLQRFHSSRPQILGAVLLSSLFFAMYHLPTNAHWQMNVSQWIYTFFLGFGFAALMLRTGSIWLPMIVHALIYTASIATNVLLTGEAIPLGEKGAIANVNMIATLSAISTLPLFLYGLYLLRGVQPGSLGFDKPSVAAGLPLAPDHT